MNIGWNGLYAKNFGDDLFFNVWTDTFNNHNVINLFNQEMSSVDKIIIGGGGLIDQYNFEYIFFRKEFLNYPTYIYGMGVNDSRAFKTEIGIEYDEYLNKCKRVFLREPIYFLNCDVQYVEDMIWSMDLPEPSRKTNAVGLSLNTTFYNNDFFHFCNNVIKLRMDIIIIDLYQHTANKDLYDSLIKAHPANRVKYIQYNRDNLNEIFSILSSLKFYVTQKLHGFIVAAMYNIPSICIGTLNKYKVIRDKLNLQHCFIDSPNELVNSFKNNINKIYDYSNVIKLQNQSKIDINNFKNIILND